VLAMQITLDEKLWGEERNFGAESYKKIKKNSQSGNEI
jgi:hypothetical protein